MDKITDKQFTKMASKVKLTDMEKKALFLLQQTLGDDTLEAILFAFFQATQDAVKGRDELIIRSIKLTLNNFFEYELVHNEDGSVEERRESGSQA